MNRRKINIILIALAIFMAGCSLGWYENVIYKALAPTRLREIRENSDNYKYINPLLFIETKRLAPELNEVKDLIQRSIDDIRRISDIENISVYFRDLNTGKWTGIDESRVYEPGSMLKVLTLIAYLKKAETNPGIFDKKIEYLAVDDPGQYYKPPTQLKNGNYSIQTLLEAMIINSDNVAAKALLKEDNSGFIKTYNTLELPKIPVSKTEDFMSPQSYSVLFRTLYNSSYLARGLSEEALHLLTSTTFTKGLVAGVASGTPIAHKFSENTTTDKGGNLISRELHDCGIVYYPEHPYFICIMTKGKDFTSLEKAIQSISKLIYNYVDKNDQAF